MNELGLANPDVLNPKVSYQARQLLSHICTAAKHDMQYKQRPIPATVKCEAVNVVCGALVGIMNTGKASSRSTCAIRDCSDMLSSKVTQA